MAAPSRSVAGPRRWTFIAAAAIPCGVLLLFCAAGAREWWLITTGQILVIPAAMAGSSSPHEVPAAQLVPWILGSGALAAAFVHALWRNSRRRLLAAYLATGLALGAVLVIRALL